MFFARLITLSVTLSLGYLVYSAFFLKWMEGLIGYPKAVGVPLAIILTAAVATFIALLGMKEEDGQIIIARDSRLAKFARFCMPAKHGAHACDVFIRLVPLAFVAAGCILLVVGLGMWVKILVTDPIGFLFIIGGSLCTIGVVALVCFIYSKVSHLVNDAIKEIAHLIAACFFVFVMLRGLIWEPIVELSKKHDSIIGGAVEYALYFVFAFGVIAACMFFRKVLRGGLPSIYGKVCRPIKG